MGQKVFLEHEDDEAEIYFTTDGSQPKIGNQFTEVSSFVAFFFGHNYKSGRVSLKLLNFDISSSFKYENLSNKFLCE